MRNNISDQKYLAAQWRALKRFFLFCTSSQVFILISTHEESANTKSFGEQDQLINQYLQREGPACIQYIFLIAFQNVLPIFWSLGWFYTSMFENIFCSCTATVKVWLPKTDESVERDSYCQAVFLRLRCPHIFGHIKKGRNGWMDGWLMDGWMDDGWMMMDGWMADGWLMDGRKDRWMDGWKEGWMDCNSSWI